MSSTTYNRMPDEPVDAKLDTNSGSAGSEPLVFDAADLIVQHGDKKPQKLPYDEIAGASVNKSGRLVVHSFPLKAAGCCSSARRVQRDLVLPCVSAEQAETYRLRLLARLDGRPDGALPRRHLLVLVNPFSGRRQGRANLAATRTIMTMRGATLEEVETTHAGHARELMLGLDVARYDGLVVVSGDGLMYEVVNGLMARSDAEAVMAALPLGIIPSGTGNGLAKSLLSAAEEPYGIIEAALLIARGGVSGLDLAEVSHGGGTAAAGTVWSFLGLMWGIVSDVDLESETCRCFGAARFDIYAAVRILALRRYRGVLRHRLAPATEWTVVEGEFVLFWANNVPWAATDMNIAPTAEFDNGRWNVAYVQQASRCQLIDGFGKLGAGQVATQSFVTEIVCSELELEPAPRTAAQPGHIDIDGEEVSFGNVRVSVKQGLARVMAQQRCVTAV